VKIYLAAPANRLLHAIDLDEAAARQASAYALNFSS
jgi:hypothetical protein